MVNVNTLDELIKNRKELIEVLGKNNFTEGIHSLLSDLYPDTAHFIYELLQNAEDMNATVVRFILSNEGVSFEHNGTKRDFNLEDIISITSIGDNKQKRDDPTSIGKFGVGFKAVFAYTQTPEIHSGEYHFKIKDYFVPEVDNLAKYSTIDKDGVSWTKFYFPFNNPKKPADIALSEINKSLKNLNETSILFLRNIKKIEYMLPDTQVGYVTYNEDENHYLTINCKNCNDYSEKQNLWLRFQKMINITDEQGRSKDLTISIAYAVVKDEKRPGKYQIVPVNGGGRTFIYFPAEKEQSGLRFHINAPFASTVARDSVRECSENNKLILAIAKLVADSLSTIKDYGLLNVSFFSVLPNAKDNLIFFYQCIFDYIYNAFRRFEYLPTKNGQHTYSTNALIGPAEISTFFDSNVICLLTGKTKIWAANAPQKNSREDYFIRSLDIEEFSYKDVIGLFEIRKRIIIEQYVSEQSDEWLKKFYELLFNIYKNNTDNNFTSWIRNSNILRSISNKMHKANEIFILPVNEKLITKTTPIIKNDFWLENGRNDRISLQNREFFENILGIKKYGPKIEIEKLLNEIRFLSKDSDEYFTNMLIFANYADRYDDVKFENYNIFAYDNNGYLSVTIADRLVLGKPYRLNCGEEIAKAYGINCLWSGYKDHYKEEQLNNFLNFTKKCGLLHELKIVRRKVCDNPLYFSSLYVDRINNGHGIDEDYIIENIEILLNLNLLSINKIIWDLLYKNGKSNNYQYIKARYSPNASAPIKSCDSSLIYFLKVFAWIPNNNNDLCKPANIMIHNIHSDFKYDENNMFFTALEIGSAVKQSAKKQERLKKEAEENGFVLIPSDELDEYEEFKTLKKRQQSTNQVKKSPTELLNNQTKRTKILDNEDDFSSDGAVNNVSKRSDNIELTFKNTLKMKPRDRKIFSKVSESSKEERSVLKSWYQGKCQMCNTSIVGHNGLPYFVAKNIINTQDISDFIKPSISLGWNSLCLCPNCAAKYTVCSRDISGLLQQIIDAKVIEGNAERIILTIELDDNHQKIYYVPKHFLALQKIFELLEKIE